MNRDGVSHDVQAASRLTNNHRFGRRGNMTHEFSPGQSSSPGNGRDRSDPASEASSIWPPRSVLEEAERRLDEHKHLILDLNGGHVHRLLGDQRDRPSAQDSLRPDAWRWSNSASRTPCPSARWTSAGSRRSVPRALLRADAIHTIHRRPSLGPPSRGRRQRRRRRATQEERRLRNLLTGAAGGARSGGGFRPVSVSRPSRIAA